MCTHYHKLDHKQDLRLDCKSSLKLWPLFDVRIQFNPEFKSDLTQNIIQPFTLPNNASDKIWLQSAFRLQRYSCLKMWTHTDTQTDEGLTGIL